MSETIPTFGYHRSEAPRIFDLKPGESLPAGWYDSPAKIPAEKPQPSPKRGRR